MKGPASTSEARSADSVRSAESARGVDRVGLGWRPELAAGIFANFSRIDAIEVIADDYFRDTRRSLLHGGATVAPAGSARRRIDSLRVLAGQVPLLLHGVGMGLASAVPVEAKRLDAMGRLVDLVRPESWSEHLAFVRGGGREIGHLAAPPRNDATVEGAARNLERARRIVGSPPEMENVATLVHPPASDLEEPEWISRIVRTSGCGLLLDLHNLHANATNHGYDPVVFLDRVPMGRVRTIHIAGGRWIGSPDGRPRLLDDHLHDVPGPVYALLVEAGRRAPHPLVVILERDGSFPPMETLLAELDAAREALARGRVIRREEMDAMARDPQPGRLAPDPVAAHTGAGP